MRETRLSFIGDELVAGHGDGRALGWTGRVMARTPRDADILWTSLAVPVSPVLARWAARS